MLEHMAGAEDVGGDGGGGEGGGGDGGGEGGGGDSGGGGGTRWQAYGMRWSPWSVDQCELCPQLGSCTWFASVASAEPLRSVRTSQ